MFNEVCDNRLECDYDCDMEDNSVVFHISSFRNAKRVRFLHGRVLFDSRNAQKCATKSDTSGHCLALSTAKKISSYLI